MDYKDEIKMAMMDPRERNNARPGRVIGEAGGGGVAPIEPRNRAFLERRIRQINQDRNYRRKQGEDVESENFAPGRNQIQQLRDELKALGDE